MWMLSLTAAASSARGRAGQFSPTYDLCAAWPGVIVAPRFAPPTAIPRAMRRLSQKFILPFKSKREKNNTHRMGAGNSHLTVSAGRTRDQGGEPFLSSHLPLHKTPDDGERESCLSLFNRRQRLHTQSETLLVLHQKRQHPARTLQSRTNSRRTGAYVG